MSRVLVTGGAGFIGGFVVEQLLERGEVVRVFDVLDPQVHEHYLPANLRRDVELMRCDVRDAPELARALRGVDAVVHLAAAVGSGQSLHHPARFHDTNTTGTALLLEALARCPVARLVVASSMSIYGEGSYRDPAGTLHHPGLRSREQLEQFDWELHGERGEPLVPVPTGETAPPRPASPYALGKFDQEQLCLMLGRAHGISTLALRLFNVYGPRQALSNPYTGVMANIASRLLNSQAPVLFEDGAQRRDFVSVHDVARAFMLALERPDINDCALNIGSGTSITIAQVVEQLAQALHVERIAPRMEQLYREGDVRHCFADVAAAEARLGYRAEIDFAHGVADMAEWLRGHHPHPSSTSRGINAA